MQYGVVLQSALDCSIMAVMMRQDGPGQAGEGTQEASRDALIEQVARRVEAAGMSAPAIAFLEANRPLAFVSSQPAVVHTLPARRSLAASPAWQATIDKAALPAYLATLAYADTPIFRLRWEIPWLGYAYPWLDEAYRATVAGEDAATALREAQQTAAAFVACLEAGDGYFDREQLRACAREVDREYPQ